MSVATAVAETTFVVEHSYDLTMDYTPSWEAVSGLEPFTDAEAAEQARLDHSEEHLALHGQPVATRVRKVVAPRPEAGYVDHFLEAEFAANRSYWAGQAQAARQQEEDRREMFRLYGKGATVEVVKGRKVPVGTTGTVFWIGESTYGGRTSIRVGFKTAENEKFFTALSNVESVTPAFEKES